ncbi:hypothetical protein TWF569_011331 [Orbilia oligospora]|uniref:Uncharacterized protein n=1 Tax=Orbilia oligospora TaxID=2813651 RepID=A0A7C8NDU1_ORBOL|nr:hypothetical protein TWF706_002736 [Orbilia oligospora]KAF3097591.1 hypothetical protein TWF103_009522 [Orbilia oligospora]KAF3098126.1 hypothetical protein TWF102_006117 [Orbilia oligospora]KAF3154676.1 hypothetical protein TWF569_011331 [Orbilia oligospora]
MRLTWRAIALPIGLANTTAARSTTRRGFIFTTFQAFYTVRKNHSGTLYHGFHLLFTSEMARDNRYGHPNRTGGPARAAASSSSSMGTEYDSLLGRPPSYTSIWTPPSSNSSLSSQASLEARSEARPGECCRCARYSFLGTACWAVTIIIFSTLFFLPGIISAVKNTPAVLPPPVPAPTPTPTSTNSPPVVPSVAPPPPPPEPPYRRAGLSGDDVPLAGSTYIISEANSSKALTHNGDEGVMMSDYQKGLMAQRWGCHEADGWLGFTVETGQTTLFLGYSPWPSPATLRCSARTLQYSEMFMVTKLEEHGFRLKMKDGNALKPVGRDSSGALAMVGTSDVWWRFTKV